MKKLPNIFFLFSFLIMTNTVLSQSANVTIYRNRDSLIKQSNQYLQKRLGLTADISAKILQEDQRQKASIDNLNQNKLLTVEQRTIELKKIRKTYLDSIKLHLTDEQWRQYQQLEAENRKFFLEKIKENHVTVKELK